MLLISQPKKQLILFLLIAAVSFSGWSQGFEGYYRFPDIHNQTVYFTAEGDIWKVELTGGLAQRLTSHPGEETNVTISPDGQTLAFSAQYEGPTEIYTMPTTGGLPVRWTYEEQFSTANTWTPDGQVIYATTHYSTLPDQQLVAINPGTKVKSRIPLSQASEANYDATGNTLYFVRPGYHRNVTKRYRGGTARQIWKFSQGDNEATLLTTGHAGESHHPMWWNNRIYFITDRDGTMNIWSMNEGGGDLKQHTKHTGFDVRDGDLANGHIVYQVGADIWHYDIGNDNSKKIPITLASDLDQLREKWEESPGNYITSVHPNADGSKIAITARGRVFVAPVKEGRFTQLSDKRNVRYRDAIFSSDGSQVIALSDESGEFEFVTKATTAVGTERQITNNGNILRYRGMPSPDGKWLAFDDLNQDMWIADLQNGRTTKISTNNEGIGQFSWSSDSKWLAFVQTAANTMAQIHIYNIDSKQLTAVTTDRANSISPVWSPDGRFLYFLSDRNFRSLVGAPWGSRQPEPYFDRKFKIYYLPLQRTYRSPFRPSDELAPDAKAGNNSEAITIDLNNIQKRIAEVPVRAGNYRGLAVNKKALYTISRETGIGAKSHLSFVKLDSDDSELKTMVSDVNAFEMTKNREKILVRKGRNYHMVAAGTSKVGNLGNSRISLSGWKFSITPKEDWKQIFTDAWRMERDYFYDQNMHGVNWQAMHDKYMPLVDRVTTRNELSDLIGRFVGELSALHTSVRGGDTRSSPQDITVASLGARFTRNERAGGYVIDYIYQADPDYPNEKSPLDDPYLDIAVGDIIRSVNGLNALSGNDLGELLRNQAGKQVRLNIQDVSTKSSRDVIVKPMGNDFNLRYRDWEYTRRLQVESSSSNQIGYVHLRAMGSNDLSQWYREFYPVFDRPGLIVDVRHNRGGNIESFILEKLMRKAWMYWKGRSGEPYWNMQYAYRGHIVVLVDENTASDGEAFAEGFRRLEMGQVIGKRTWGGEIWLSGVNRLTDGGIARAPMFGVYGAEGEWLIENHGFEPDVEVDNLPHATFNGKDAQLEAAIAHLQELIRKDPRSVPPVPAYPDKSFDNK